jgi:hypothetical protein
MGMSTWISEHPVAATTIGLLALTDLVFLGLHLGNLHAGTLGAFQDPDFALNRERGFAEVYGYLKLLWAAALLVLVAARRRSLLVLTLAGVVVGLLLDDALTLHELLAERLAPALVAGPGEMAASHVGQVLIGVGLAVASVVALAVVWRSPPPDVRRLVLGCAVAIGLLGVFGVGVDAVHSALEPTLDRTLDVVEDGGELVAITALLGWIVTWSTTDLVQRRPRPPVTAAAAHDGSPSP